MIGDRLREFDLDLCDYAVGHFRSGLRAPRRPPSSSPAVGYREWVRLDAAAWRPRVVEKLPALLADHVWAGVLGDKVERPLTERELDALASAAADPPPRCERDFVWVPYPALHRQYLECVPDIRVGLTRQTAEEWAAASAGFAARLCEKDLPLAAGVEVAGEWLTYARQLLGAMASPSIAKGREPAGKTRGRVAGDPAALLTPAEVAAKYAIGLSTVYAASRSGGLSHYRVPSKTGARGKYLFRESDVTAWIESHRAGAVPATPSASASSIQPAGTFSELDPAKLARAWLG